MSIRIIIISICLMVIPARMLGDSYSDYIERYSKMAVGQMERYGIPASITLAQGLLESAAGRSTLAKEGNNHFGIKCHSDWTGKTMLRDDDAADECFRVYDNVEQSFNDHSKFLLRKRYAPLFDLELTDYSGWARGLSRCGYATDPNYADRLITIIERYALYSYDGNGAERGHEVAEFIISKLSDTHPVRRSRGLHYVVAAPGDTYGSIAKEFKIGKKDLMRYNDVSKDGEIRAWQEVYLEEKFDKGPDGVASATIGEDESMHSLSQRYGVKLERLKAMNPGVKDRPGSRLKLR